MCGGGMGSQGRQFGTKPMGMGPFGYGDQQGTQRLATDAFQPQKSTEYAVTQRPPMQAMPFQNGQMPNQNPMAAFNRQPFQTRPQAMDPRTRYQQSNATEAPLSGAYDYSGGYGDQAQEKTGLYPGAPTPPGYQAPPPGPWANYMDPMLASMIGYPQRFPLPGGRPLNSFGAFNTQTNQWMDNNPFRGG